MIKYRMSDQLCYIKTIFVAPDFNMCITSETCCKLSEDLLSSSTILNEIICRRLGLVTFYKGHITESS